MGYVTNEAALLTLVTTNISGYTTDNTKLGDADAAFAYALENNTNLCVLDYYGCGDDNQPDPHGKFETWRWKILVTFFIAYDKDTIETDIRTLADNFVVLRRDNKRLTTGSTWEIQEGRTFGIITRPGGRTFVPMAFVVSVKEML